MIPSPIIFAGGKPGFTEIFNQVIPWTQHYFSNVSQRISYRQVIAPGDWGRDFSRLRLVIDAPGAITHVSVGVLDSGYATKAIPVEATFKGVAGLASSYAMQQYLSDEIELSFLRTDALVCVFDFPNLGSVTTNRGYGVPCSFAQVYARAGVASYNVAAPTGYAVPSGNYMPPPEWTLVCVSRILGA